MSVYNKCEYCEQIISLGGDDYHVFKDGSKVHSECLDEIRKECIHHTEPEVVNDIFIRGKGFIKECTECEQVWTDTDGLDV